MEKGKTFVQPFQGPKRTGGISIKQVQEAMRTIYNFDPAEFESEELIESCGHGFMVICDLKAAGFTLEERLGALPEGTIEAAKAHLAENCKCGQTHTDADFDNAPTFGVSDACSITTLVVGYKAFNGLLRAAAESGEAIKIARMMRELDLHQPTH